MWETEDEHAAVAEDAAGLQEHPQDRGPSGRPPPTPRGRMYPRAAGGSSRRPGRTRRRRCRNPGDVSRIRVVRRRDQRRRRCRHPTQRCRRCPGRRHSPVRRTICRRRRRRSRGSRRVYQGQTGRRARGSPRCRRSTTPGGTFSTRFTAVGSPVGVSPCNDSGRIGIVLPPVCGSFANSAKQPVNDGVLQHLAGLVGVGITEQPPGREVLSVSQRPLGRGLCGPDRDVSSPNFTNGRPRWSQQSPDRQPSGSTKRTRTER